MVPDTLADYGALIFVFGCLTIMVKLLVEAFKYGVDHLSAAAERFDKTDQETNRLLEQLFAQNEAQTRAAQAQVEALTALAQDFVQRRTAQAQAIGQAVDTVTNAIATTTAAQTDELRGIIEDAIGRYTAEIAKRVEKIERIPDKWKELLRAATEETRAEFTRELDRVLQDLKASCKDNKNKETEEGTHGRNLQPNAQ